MWHVVGHVGWATPARKGLEAARPLRQVLSHQGIEVVAQQGPVVVDLPLQDDEQEEQPQQDVPQVAQDVVEGAVRKDRGAWPRPYLRQALAEPSPPPLPPPIPSSLPKTPT